jgi:peroxiredoxin
MLALLPVFAFAQDPQAFSIKGKIGGLNAPARAYLIYQYGSNKVIDSAIITAGDYNFTGQIVNPSNAIMVIDHDGVGFDKLNDKADILRFYIDKGDFSITSPDSVSKAKITGSRINDENIKLNALLAPLQAKAKKLSDDMNAATPAQKESADFKASVRSRQKELQATQRTLLQQFITANPNSYLSLLALYSVDGPSPNPAVIEPLYNSLSNEVKSTETAKVFKKSLDALMVTAPGSMAPDFTQNDVNGVPVKLSSFKGKYVLIDFWASWCGPCRQENPNVVKAFNKYKDKNFTVLGVSLDKPEGRDNWLAAIKADGLNWTQVSDLKYWSNAAAGLYYVSSIPANFLIGPDGKIIAKDLRGDDLEDKLKELLK